MTRTRLDSFATRSAFTFANKSYQIFHLGKLEQNLSRLPYSIRLLLENLLRQEDGLQVTRQDIEALRAWEPKAESRTEISFMPARVLLQDFTGVPAVVDLAAMRDAMIELGGDPGAINPGLPVDLVIDHSVQVDKFGSPEAFKQNADLEFERNHERYQLLRWAQVAFGGFRAVPPDTGIVHQVNLEYLASVVMEREDGGVTWLLPDTLVGTDSHTTMINGLGVLGWGVGGIEAEAAMLNQPVSMLIPEVVGFRLSGQLPAGSTATDLVLTVVQMLRRKGVVGKFVEFYGPGLDKLPLADRATIANMAPEYGATMGFFPVDAETLNYLRFTGRAESQVALIEAYLKAQGLFRSSDAAEPQYSDKLELDLGTIQPCIAGPKRPQDRILLSDSKRAYREALVNLAGGEAKEGQADAFERWVDAAVDVREGSSLSAVRAPAPLDRKATVSVDKESVDKESVDKESVDKESFDKESFDKESFDKESVDKESVDKESVDKESFELEQGAVVIAAITSCTNTSNPSVMVAAGLLAKKAVEKGLKRKPWVKSSLAPGSQVVGDYLDAAGLQAPLDALGFHVVGFGCTTCIGNSGPLLEPIAEAIRKNDLVAVSVLSGNRNFEGRINPDVRANYLASPPLVVAYALAGTMDIDLQLEPLGVGSDGKPVYLKEIWPSPGEIDAALSEAVKSEMFTSRYAAVFEGDASWKGLNVPQGDLYAWNPASLYIRKPPFFEGMALEPPGLSDVRGARTLALLGDSVTTDHISPAGSIAEHSPASRYLSRNGLEKRDYNSYGSRRGNHEVMMRGTFANIRLRNLLAPGSEGGVTRHFPSGRQMTLWEASLQYKVDDVPLIILAGKEYGTGSSRDWAAKGTNLLGVRAVLAESFERIHRSNLVGMGVLPLQFKEGEGVEALELTGAERYDINGLESLDVGQTLTVQVKPDEGDSRSFEVLCRIDTPQELSYFRHGGILQYALRRLLKGSS